MSPTPEQFTTRRQFFLEFEGKQQKLRKGLSELNEAVVSINSKCCRIIGGETHEKDCRLAGYLLDSQDRIISLHPIIFQVLAGGGAVEEKLFVMLGSNFSESIEIKDESFVLNFGHGGEPTSDVVQVRYYKAWEERYPIVSSFFTDKRTLLAADDKYNCSARGVISILDMEKPDVDTASGVVIKEAMIVALANAAGINPEDEKSDDFPLLLEQLKRIKAERKI